MAVTSRLSARTEQFVTGEKSIVKCHFLCSFGTRDITFSIIVSYKFLMLSKNRFLENRILNAEEASKTF